MMCSAVFFLRAKYPKIVDNDDKLSSIFVI